MADKEPCAAAAAQNNEEDDAANLEQEVTEGNWTRPEVEVHEVKVETGEENEDTFWKCRSKLYRWAAGSEWKERGLGEAKLLQHKETKKIRFLLRQEKTLKIVANHYVVATDVYCKLTPNVSSEKIWVWTVMDFAEGELKNEQFALKFGQIEQAKEFKEKFEEAAAINSKLFGIGEGGSKAKEGEKAETKEQKEDSDKTEKKSDETSTATKTTEATKAETAEKESKQTEKA
ncbi:ran-specific GTPase-activating protein, putative [Eimeria acervulina]|uniref:Ran-specific GTPase-activating protein, putative n=1 Tax=Eimeria acervulina TaxID=5801 RepID=U6GHC0_EIMAC|nr:ran-specific GTPase-activating protein, putative [Eimeria acervulina]CDI78972.1 ran-specific GTPase-activating protein, putative [Eimeria acervulina]